ncbi:hypothetical protein G6011_00092 [Alternaria panax]|uniref:Uncharacterized protein n=1 Tax=Alternaria panax TaxID=48097 RepID=A0AAD4II25_9PLEO|nr:hypothetical protein G6011_00092 [Alternaria panax]
MPKTLNIIRDAITIDANLPFIKDIAPGDTLRLIARQITLAETFDASGKNLELYASTFTALNSAIIRSVGSSGSDGVEGKDRTAADRPAGSIDGVDGETGREGEGGASVVIKVFAEVAVGLIIHVTSGAGGTGGTGGLGGNGTSKTEQSAGEVTISLGNAGNGGSGGRGGPEGKGSIVTLRSVNFSPDPIITISKGMGGPGGGGNKAGRPGRPPTSRPVGAFIFPGLVGTNGQSGDHGSEGFVVKADQKAVSFNEFWSALASESFAVDWAKYRHAVGEFFFRRWIPGVDGRDHFIGLAVDEFEAASRLNPKQAESEFRLKQLRSGLNPLGLPQNFDVIPDFERYIDKVHTLATLLATFENIAINFLIESSNVDLFGVIFKGQKNETKHRIEEATVNLEESKLNRKNIEIALQELKMMIATVKKRIEDSKEEMKQKPVRILGVIKTVGELAGAVAAVMGAVPTGGASLLFLAPNIISFTKTIYDNGGDIFKAIIDNKEAEALAQAKKEFDTVKGNYEDIQDTSKKIGNMVDTIDKIRVAKSPENSKLMGLVQKGAELAYEYLLKLQELQMAQLKSEALRKAISSEQELQVFYANAIEQGQIERDKTRETGLKVLQAVRSRVDTLLGFAFRAQRSIEIYLLKDQKQAISYDVGRVHPDLEAEYTRTGQNISFLLSAYQSSFNTLLQVEDLQDVWEDFFDKLHLRDTHRMSFDDTETLDAFRSTFTLTFDFDVAQLSDKRFRTKIQAVGIAFVGAKGEGDQVSCRLEHGGLYSEKDIDGEVQFKVMVARHDIISAQVTPLSPAGFDLGPHPPLSEAQGSNLWAMGVGGVYILTIPEDEIAEHNANLDELTRIQIWIGYQFTE